MTNQYMCPMLERKMRKLARRCAEANTWVDKAGTKTYCHWSDVWEEAFQLIRLAGLEPEYRKRVEQINKTRM